MSIFAMRVPFLFVFGFSVQRKPEAKRDFLRTVSNQSDPNTHCRSQSFLRSGEALILLRLAVVIITVPTISFAEK